METGNEIDQFELLERKIEALIERIGALKSEKAALSERVLAQEERITDLTTQVDTLRSGNERARQRIAALLDKIEEIDV
ncbi:MAG: cell division protein ZapB [Deltaproteobacteria bacterium]|nr:cell division protein ZapB [Deltaproteobacteria bacterium]MBW1922218.1 cell division protein ZapB [Deltaproteobacteria bacterium]MBW1948638.1 cell division protein ZapB [Deltaproteobacteria bacterium]MBW2006800.1 cell division protein ZapB [Deltaproteobacteria bacterium]MBW2101082.1 cell division protein ZapB [Deltaproteobacteria bacterium]